MNVLSLMLSLAVAGDVHVSFEELVPGSLTPPKSGWSAAPRHAEIHDQHAHSGARCLRIHGGAERAAEWTFDAPLELHELAFRAERWTRRDPFRFEVFVREGDAWSLVHDASDEVRVGGFLARVQVPLGERSVSGLRFRCTSPEGAGVMIDDLELGIVGPMRIASVTADAPRGPVFPSSELEPVGRVTVRTEGNREPLELTGLWFELAGEGWGSEVELWAGGEEFDRRSATLLAGAKKNPSLAPTRPGMDGRELGYTDLRETLRPGPRTFWLLARPETSATTLRARCTALHLPGHVVAPTDAHWTTRTATPLRRAGDDGIAAYRIPGLVTTNEGTLIAVHDNRHHGPQDLPGDIDVGMQRSTDDGATWSAMRPILDMGEPHASNGVGDPAILVDRATNRILVLALWSKGDRAWHGSGPGLSPDETGQLVLTSSTDDGLTWSAPRNLTREVKDPRWRLLLQGPGRGITMEDGTLVFAAQFKDANDVPHATVLTSSDHGETWRVGTGAKPDTTEAQVVELEPGVLMLNMRDNRGGARSVAITRDLGETWEEHATSRKALREPVCMASLIRVPHPTGDLLLFSNPDVASPPRRNLSIKVSRDLGATWSDGFLLDAGTSAGYSCMTLTRTGEVAILYEGSGAALVFQKIPLEHLLAGT